MQKKYSGRIDAFNNEESFGLKEIDNFISEDSPFKVTLLQTFSIFRILPLRILCLHSREGKSVNNQYINAQGMIKRVFLKHK
jgi:hypothetical protein